MFNLYSKTVDGIVGDLDKIVHRLNTLIDSKVEKIDENDTVITQYAEVVNKLKAEQDTARKEIVRASKVIVNINNLLQK